MSDKGFSQKQLEQLGQLMDYKLQPVVERLDKLESKVDNIDKRLTAVEQNVKDLKQDVKDIKSCPTIAKELKENKK